MEQEIVIWHYSHIKSLKGKIIEKINDDIFNIKVINNMFLINYKIGQPIIFKEIMGINPDIIGADIKEIDLSKNLIKVKADSVKENLSDIISTSAEVDIKISKSKKSCKGILKAISSLELLIYSKCQFYHDQKVILDIYTKNTIITLNGTVIKQNKNNHYYEITITYTKVNQDSMLIKGAYESFLKAP